MGGDVVNGLLEPVVDSVIQKDIDAHSITFKGAVLAGAPPRPVKCSNVCVCHCPILCTGVVPVDPCMHALQGW